MMKMKMKMEEDMTLAHRSSRTPREFLRILRSP